MLASPLWETAALALGLLVGSFANVCTHRLPRGQSVVTPRSRCPHCGSPIRAWQNVPVLSFLMLRGRCASCRASISLRYPAVEAANGILYLLIAVAMGPTPRALAAMAWVTALLVLALIDLDHRILPDVITLPGVVLGVAASFLPGRPPGAPSPLAAAVAAGAAYLSFWALAAAAEWYYGEEALGQGDWKMAAMLGAFLGGSQAVLAVFLGALSGSLVGLGLMAFGGASGRTKVPFGTFLALGGVLSLLAGHPILGWYRGLFGG